MSKDFDFHHRDYCSGMAEFNGYGMEVNMDNDIISAPFGEDHNNSLDYPSAQDISFLGSQYSSNPSYFTSQRNQNPSYSSRSSRGPNNNFDQQTRSNRDQQNMSNRGNYHHISQLNVGQPFGVSAYHSVDGIGFMQDNHQIFVQSMNNLPLQPMPGSHGLEIDETNGYDSQPQGPRGHGNRSPEQRLQRGRRQGSGSSNSRSEDNKGFQEQDQHSY